MKQKLIYSKEDKRFYSVLSYTEEEKQRNLEEGRRQADRGEFAVILDSPKAIQNFKREVKEKYDV